jgi:hypothetical protein
MDVHGGRSQPVTIAGSAPPPTAGRNRNRNKPQETEDQSSSRKGGMPMKEEPESKSSIQSATSGECATPLQESAGNGNGAPVEVTWRVGPTLTETERQWLLRLLFQKSIKRQRESRTGDTTSSDGVECPEHNVPRRRRQPPRGRPTTWESTWPI